MNNNNALESEEEKEKTKCLAALFQTLSNDPSDDAAIILFNKRVKRAEDTCKWILDDQNYKTWRDSPSKLLWICGGPGKGKTIMSIFLGEAVRVLAQTRLCEKAVTIHCFCVNNDDKRNTAVSILRTLIFQLLAQELKMFKHIVGLYKVRKEALFNASSFETLWKIFESMVSDPAFDRVYCILDGLDECEKDSQTALSEKIGALFSQARARPSTSRLSLMVVSRPDRALKNLKSSKNGCLTVDLDSDLNSAINEDVERFITTEVDSLAVMNEWPKNLRNHVRMELLRRASGIYLWVGFVIQELREKLSSEVERTLNRLPTGMEALYSRILLDIREDRCESAARILRCVVVAIRPLTLTELSIAIELEPTQSEGMDEDDMKRQRILVMEEQIAFCGYMLSISGDKVELRHQSVKDYLTQDQMAIQTKG